MTRLSLLDKLGVLINVSQQSVYFLIALIVLVAIGFGLSFINPRNEKRYKLIYIIAVVAIVLVLGITYSSSLGKMIKYMMDNFFIAVFFPNLAIYLAAIIVMNIIIWVSILSYRSSRLIRNLNIIVYVIMNYLLILILHIIVNQKLDVYNQASVYKNTNARALIELSSGIFIIWIIFLIIYKLVLIYIRKDYKPKVKKIIVHKKEKILPDNFEPKSIPDIIYGNAPRRETIVINKEPEIKVVEKEERFTLEEYKLFYEILKKQSKKKHDKEEVKVETKIVDPVEEIITPVQENKKPVEKVELPKIVTEVKRANDSEEYTRYRATDNETTRMLYGGLEDVIIEQEDNKKYDTEPLPEIVNVNNSREAQKQEIIRMEEERRELLRKEQERLEKEKQEKLKEQQRQQEIRNKNLEEMRIKEEQEKIAEIKKQKELKEQEEKEQEDKRLEEELLKQRLLDEEREQEKLTELERLYRSIR